MGGRGRNSSRLLLLTQRLCPLELSGTRGARPARRRPPRRHRRRRRARWRRRACRRPRPRPRCAARRARPMGREVCLKRRGAIAARIARTGGCGGRNRGLSTRVRRQRVSAGVPVCPHLAHRCVIGMVTPVDRDDAGGPVLVRGMWRARGCDRARPSSYGPCGRALKVCAPGCASCTAFWSRDVRIARNRHTLR